MNPVQRVSGTSSCAAWWGAIDGGRRAGAHAHRSRHTLAATFLRNGGNALARQAMLGHESLEMVKRTLQIAQTDLQKAHQDASPVMNWLL
jgi:integrase/recombinase XerD